MQRYAYFVTVSRRTNECLKMYAKLSVDTLLLIGNNMLISNCAPLSPALGKYFLCFWMY